MPLKPIRPGSTRLEIGDTVTPVYPATELFVANANSFVVQANPTMPNSIYHQDHADDANVILFDPQGFALVEWFHIVRGVGGAVPTLDTQPTIRAFGRIPSNSDRANRFDPARYDKGFPTLEGATLHGGWWRPLFSLRDRVNDQSFTLGPADVAKTDTTGGEEQVFIYGQGADGGPPHHNLVGVDMVMCVVTVAAAGTNIQGVIAGVLSNQ